MVSIPDFESGNPGSNPGETYNLTIAQLAEQWTVNPFVGCSNHPSEIFFWFRDVMVSISDFESDNPGSNPGGTFYPRGAMDSASDF